MGTANELAAFFLPKSGFDKTIIYRAVTHHYQVVFQKTPREEKKDIVVCNLEWK